MIIRTPHGDFTIMRQGKFYVIKQTNSKVVEQEIETYNGALAWVALFIHRKECEARGVPL
jgi:hypothetical protein